MQYITYKSLKKCFYLFGPEGVRRD